MQRIGSASKLRSKSMLKSRVQHDFEIAFYSSDEQTRDRQVRLGTLIYLSILFNSRIPYFVIRSQFGVFGRDLIENCKQDIFNTVELLRGDGLSHFHEAFNLKLPMVEIVLDEITLYRCNPNCEITPEICNTIIQLVGNALSRMCFNILYQALVQGILENPDDTICVSIMGGSTDKIGNIFGNNTEKYFKYLNDVKEYFCANFGFPSDVFVGFFVNSVSARIYELSEKVTDRVKLKLAEAEAVAAESSVNSEFERIFYSLTKPAIGCSGSVTCASSLFDSEIPFFVIMRCFDPHGDLMSDYYSGIASAIGSLRRNEINYLQKTLGLRFNPKGEIADEICDEVAQLVENTLAQMCLNFLYCAYLGEIRENSGFEAVIDPLYIPIIEVNIPEIRKLLLGNKHFKQFNDAEEYFNRKFDLPDDAFMTFCVCSIGVKTSEILDKAKCVSKYESCTGGRLNDILSVESEKETMQCILRALYLLKVREDRVNVDSAPIRKLFDSEIPRWVIIQVAHKRSSSVVPSNIMATLNSFSVNELIWLKTNFGLEFDPKGEVILIYNEIFKFVKNVFTQVCFNSLFEAYDRGQLQDIYDGIRRGKYAVYSVVRDSKYRQISVPLKYLNTIAVFETNYGDRNNFTLFWDVVTCEGIDKLHNEILSRPDDLSEPVHFRSQYK